MHEPDGTIKIFGYPEDVFPPTDFHTATHLGNYIYIIGSLGYQSTRRVGETPVYRLDLQTFHMEWLDIRGESPGWIYKHRSTVVAQKEIKVWGGELFGGTRNAESRAFILDLDRHLWISMDR